MAEYRLANLRIGFDYAADVTFPAGFLGANESVRAKLRKFRGSTESWPFTDSRVGDTVTLDLPVASQTGIVPGLYMTELVIYDTLNPATPEIPLADNVYLIEADYDLSE